MLELCIDETPKTLKKIYSGKDFQKLSYFTQNCIKTFSSLKLFKPL